MVEQHNQIYSVLISIASKICNPIMHDARGLRSNKMRTHMRMPLKPSPVNTADVKLVIIASHIHNLLENIWKL